MPNKLSASPPYLWRGRSTEAIMGDVLIALTPALIAALWYFHLRALWLLLTTTAVCAVTEAVCLFVRRQRGFDGSAVVTGLLLGLSLPAGTNLWAAAIASFFAVAVVKQAFGGIGHHLLNPAMAGRALLMVAWPQTLGGYTLPDAVSSATPLSHIGGENFWNMLVGYKSGSLGETSAVLILLGGAYLYLRGTIRLRVPVTCLAAFAVFIWLFGGPTFLTGDPTSHLLSGSILFGAFFIITDYVTKPTTPWGEILFAAGVGILTAVLRLWGPYPEGVCFAVLLMNLAAPLIEYLTRRRVYGTGIPGAARAAV